MIQDIQYIKTKANLIRHLFIEDMEKHLLTFDQKVKQHGISVEWVENEDDLSTVIQDCFEKQSYNRICFDSSIIPSDFKEKNQRFKTISIEKVLSSSDNIENLVVEANFGIVEDGSIILLNKSTKSCFNKVENLHIILKINNLVIKKSDLELLLYLYQYENNSYQFPTDVKIITAPLPKVSSKPTYLDNQSYEVNPIKTYLYLYDGGISKILENPILRESLFCINCGRCQQVCPVYKQTQLFSPIDLVTNNCFEENQRTMQLFKNTTLCGNCNDVCPVLIPLTDLMLTEMQIIKNKHSREKNIDLFKFYSKRSKMNKINNRFFKYFFVKKHFKNNKRLLNYIQQQKLPFFNIENLQSKTKNE